MADDWETKYKRLKNAMLILAADINEMAIESEESGIKLSPVGRKTTEFGACRVRMCADSIRNTVNELDALPSDAPAGLIESAIVRARSKRLQSTKSEQSWSLN